MPKLDPLVVSGDPPVLPETLHLHGAASPGLPIEAALQLHQQLGGCGLATDQQTQRQSQQAVHRIGAGGAPSNLTRPSGPGPPGCQDLTKSGYQGATIQRARSGVPQAFGA